MSHLVGIGIVFAFLLPHSSTALLLVNPLLCIFYKSFKQNRGRYKYNWIVLFPIIISVLINLPQDVSSKSIISAAIVLFYFFCFPLVGKVRIYNGYFYFVLFFIMVSQLAYAFDINFMESILDSVYPLTEEEVAEIYAKENVNAGNLIDFRLGGIYHNANHTSKYVSFLFATFLCLNYEKPIKQLLPFAILVFISVLLTGSRTGFIVAGLVLIDYFLLDKRQSAPWRRFAAIAFIGAFVFLILGEFGVLRGLNVIQGFNDSANIKADTFAYYLSSENSIIKLLFGNLDESKFGITVSIANVMKTFDSDYGDIIYCYGFVGFVLMFVYFFKLFIKVKREQRVFFVLLLWMFTSTIVVSYRAFFIFMLLLSIVYNDSKNKV